MVHYIGIPALILASVYLGGWLEYRGFVNRVEEEIGNVLAEVENVDSHVYGMVEAYFKKLRSKL